jgi:DNA-binding NarL/FixJ family response regulator
MMLLLITNNLMTRSWLGPPLTAAGVDLSAPAKAEAPDLIAVDLTNDGAVDAVARLRAAHPGARILAFGPHVDAEAFRAARGAGADEAVARGKVLQRLLALASGGA